MTEGTAHSQEPEEEEGKAVETCPFCSAAIEDEGPVCRECGFDLDSDWSPASQEEEQAKFDPTKRVCTSCGALNAIGVDFCSECNAPVGDYASVKPFEEILVEGALYRGTVNGGTDAPLVVRIGRVLIAGPFIVLPALALVALAWSFLDGTTWAAAAGMFTGLLSFALLLWVVLRIFGAKMIARLGIGFTPVVPAVLVIFIVAIPLLNGWTPEFSEAALLTAGYMTASAISIWIGLRLLGLLPQQIKAAQEKK